MKKTAIEIPEGCTEVLLHACCAPCSSAIVEWLMANGVRPTIYYYNPNIWPREEYVIRKEESKRHATALGIEWIDDDYNHEVWKEGVCGLENEPERGRRCEQCFTLRLMATARKAAELGIKYFATTLASSRWKSLEQIERAGLAAEQAVNAKCTMGSVLGPEGQSVARNPLCTQKEPSLLCKYWAQNWRKGGLQERRNQLLKEYGFYNQQYCGCEYSARNGALTKPLLRQQMREAKKLHQDKLPQMSEEIVEKLQQILTSSLQSRVWRCESPLNTIMAYWPLPDEVDIRPLIHWLVGQGKVVVLPKVTGYERMELRSYTSQDDLAEGAFHILEPVGEPFTDYGDIDVVLVPGMAFDAAGHRLGRGKGYYDRFLAAHFSPLTSHPSPLLIGVCFPFQRVAEVPTEEYDVCMNEVYS